jgi:hypothetical protein
MRRREGRYQCVQSTERNARILLYQPSGAVMFLFSLDSLLLREMLFKILITQIPLKVLEPWNSRGKAI